MMQFILVVADEEARRIALYVVFIAVVCLDLMITVGESSIGFSVKIAVLATQSVPVDSPADVNKIVFPAVPPTHNWKDPSWTRFNMQ